MSHSFRTVMLRLIVAFAVVHLPATAAAQTMGADDFEPPEDELPGEPTTAPPTSPADGEASSPGADGQTGVHDASTAPSAPTPGADQLPAGDHTTSVRVVHATDPDVDLSGKPVMLEAIRPAGPLQPDSHEQTVASWDGITDSDGIAHFDALPDDLRQWGLQLRASTSYGGLSFDSPAHAPGEGSPVELTVFERAHTLPYLRLSRKRVLVSPWEEYLIFDQFWTLEIDGDRAFDVSSATDPALERGLPLRLPYTAEGISAAGPGDFQIVDNVVYWTGVLQPNQPVTLQVRFSHSVRSSQFIFQHPMQYDVDDIQVLAAVDTDFQKVSRLEDLALVPPDDSEFVTGTDPSVVGLHAERDYLVAHGHSIDAGESYHLRFDGLPFGRPVGAWVAVVGGLLAALFIAAYARREYHQLTEAGDEQRRQALDALRAKKEDLLDELVEVERRLQHVEDDSDRAIDLEHQRTLIRRQLALVWSEIDELQGDDASSGS